MVRAAKAGIAPERIGDMTFYEVFVEMAGANRRHAEGYRIAAWHLAPIYTFMAGKAVTQADLLGERPERRNVAGDAAAVREILEGSR